MALDANSMGQAIAAAVSSAAPPPGQAISPAQLEAMWIAISQAIIDEFVANGQVIGTVTSGAGAGGAVEGTIL